MPAEMFHEREDDDDDEENFSNFDENGNVLHEEDEEAAALTKKRPANDTDEFFHPKDYPNANRSMLNPKGRESDDEDENDVENVLTKLTENKAHNKSVENAGHNTGPL